MGFFDKMAGLFGEPKEEYEEEYAEEGGAEEEEMTSFADALPGSSPGVLIYSRKTMADAIVFLLMVCAGLTL